MVKAGIMKERRPELEKAGIKVKNTSNWEKAGIIIYIGLVVQSQGLVGAMT